MKLLTARPLVLRRLLLPLALTITLTACSSDDESEAPNTPDDTGQTTDTGEADDTGTDVGLDTPEPDTGGTDAGPDTADVAEPWMPPAATTFKVGVGRERMPVPLGIGTAGFGQIALGGGGAKSRYADSYPATSAIYTHPSFHAVAIEADAAPDNTPVLDETHRVVLLRADLIGITQEARRAVVAEVLERGGPDLAHALIISATHTHSGPGRLIDNAIWAAITDAFFPAFYNRMVGSMADAVMEALDDLEPAKFGYTVLDTDEFHNDRRCENPDLIDGRLPLLRFDRADGELKALVMLYAVHSTVLDSKRRTLSRDFHGGMELKVEEQFDHPVTALFFNSWSGDMSPQTHSVEETYGVHSDYNGIEAAGNAMGSLVAAALDGITMSDTIVVRSATGRVPLGLDALGYGEDEFAWSSGAVYCGGAGDAPCFGNEPPDPNGLITGCIPFPDDEPAPMDTMVGMFQLGELFVATLPGEPLTSLGVETIATITEQTGAEDVYLLGYAQDYIGYSLTEEDWFLGGYETGGSLWGPKQGDYLSARVIELANSFITGADLPWESLVDPAPAVYTPEPIVAETESGEAIVSVQPNATYEVGDTVVVSFHGGDPWLLAPEVTLQKQDGETFAPVLRKNGRAVSTDGYEFELSLAVAPTYEETLGPVVRTFEWTVAFPTRRGAPSTLDTLTGGPYRLALRGTLADGTSYELFTEPFQIGE